MTKIKVYTTSYCPYCKRAKSLLESKNLEYEEINLTTDSELRLELEKKHNWRTVPMILINDELIGGFDDLAKLEREDELDNLIAKSD